VSDIDTVVVDSLKALDPKRPIREADIAQCSRHVRFVLGTDIVRPATQASGDLVDQVEPLPTFNGVAGSAGLVGTPER
jgi:hypothetical protein